LLLEMPKRLRVAVVPRQKVKMPYGQNIHPYDGNRWQAVI
jgi:hypothetical protein